MFSIRVALTTTSCRFAPLVDAITEHSKVLTIFCVVMHVLLRIFLFYFISNVLQPSECTQEAVLHRHVGKYLTNHVLRTEQTESEFQCVTHCVGHSSTCASVNYKISGTDVGKCELNSQALQAATMKLDEDPDFNYLDFTQRVRKNVMIKDCVT